MQKEIKRLSKLTSKLEKLELERKEIHEEHIKVAKSYRQTSTKILELQIEITERKENLAAKFKKRNPLTALLSTLGITKYYKKMNGNQTPETNYCIIHLNSELETLVELQDKLYTEILDLMKKKEELDAEIKDVRNKVSRSPYNHFLTVIGQTYSAVNNEPITYKKIKNNHSKE